MTLGSVHVAELWRTKAGGPDALQLLCRVVISLCAQQSHCTSAMLSVTVQHYKQTPAGQ